MFPLSRFNSLKTYCLPSYRSPTPRMQQQFYLPRYPRTHNVKMTLSRCISAIKRSVITIAVPLAVQRLIFCYISDGCSHALIQIPNSSVRFLCTSQQLLSLTTLVDFFPYRWGSIWVLASQMLHHIPWNVVLKFTCCTFFGN